MVRGYVDLLVEKMYDVIGRQDNDKLSEEGTKLGGVGVVDMVRVYKLTTFDIMGDLTFGGAVGPALPLRIHPLGLTIFATVKLTTLLRLIRYYPWLSALSSFLTPKALLERKAEYFRYCIERVDKRLAIGSPRPDI